MESHNKYDKHNKLKNNQNACNNSGWHLLQRPSIDASVPVSITSIYAVHQSVSSRAVVLFVEVPEHTYEAGVCIHAHVMHTQL